MAKQNQNIGSRHGSGAMELLAEVERHLTHSGMSAARFGRMVMNDPGFVRELRLGRDPRIATQRRVRGWLKAMQTEAAR